MPNLVVTKDGRIGSIDARALTPAKVHEYGAYFQAKLADQLRELGIRTGYDAEDRPSSSPTYPTRPFPCSASETGRSSATQGQFARENDIEWDELSVKRKRQLLHEASADGRLGKTKEDARTRFGASRRPRSAGRTTRSSTQRQHPALDGRTAPRYRLSYAAASISREFQTAAVIDYDKLRVHAARGLIAAGDQRRPRRRRSRRRTHGGPAASTHNGVPVALVSGVMGGQDARHQYRANPDRTKPFLSGAAGGSGPVQLSLRRSNHAAMQIASIKRRPVDPIYSRAESGDLRALGAAASSPCSRASPAPERPLCCAPSSPPGRRRATPLVGMSTAWKQADALKEADIEETWALQPLLNAIDTGEFQPASSTVLVIDEISQIAPRPMLKLLELQAETGMTIKMLGDREQVQSIEAGDTIELLRRVLPKSAMPEVLAALRQKNARDRKISRAVSRRLRRRSLRDEARRRNRPFARRRL